MLPKVTIFTDGSCKAHQVGGWAAYLQYGTDDLFMCDKVQATTNNRMELQAVISSLSQLQYPCEVDLYSDSQYVIKGIASWLSGWKRNNWRTSTGKPVMNRDLWQQLDQLLGQHQVNPYWVKGHNGNPGNEICDQLANSLFTVG